MRDPAVHTRNDALTGQGRSDGIDTPRRKKPGAAEALSLKSAALVAVPAAAVLAVGASSIYATVALTNQLAELRASVDLLLARRTTAAAVEDADAPGISKANPVNSIAPLERSNPSPEQFQQIEAQLAELTTGLTRLASKMDQIAQPTTSARTMAPPPLPPMQAPGFALGHDEVPIDDPSWQDGVTDELRSEANEILQEYAEQARLEIQAQHDAGLLDPAAMARIKTETRLQAASALESRLPPEVYKQLFPTGSAESGM